MNAARPGSIRTPQTAEAWAEGTHQRYRLRGRTPFVRIGLPGEVTDASIYLASDATLLTPGETITIDGGFIDCGFE